MKKQKKQTKKRIKKVIALNRLLSGRLIYIYILNQFLPLIWYDADNELNSSWILCSEILKKLI